MRTMDLIEPGFRPLYEAVCVGNRGEDAQHIFFEGMLLKEGFGTCAEPLSKAAAGQRKVRDPGTLLTRTT